VQAARIPRLLLERRRYHHLQMADELTSPGVMKRAICAAYISSYLLPDKDRQMYLELHCLASLADRLVLAARSGLSVPSCGRRDWE